MLGGVESFAHPVRLRVYRFLIGRVTHELIPDVVECPDIRDHA